MGKNAQKRIQAKNRGWDDLNKTAREIRVSLPKPFLAIHETLSNKAIKDNLDPTKVKKIVVLLKTLQEDTGFFIETSDKISSLHKNKSGGWKTDNDLMQILECSEQHRKLQAQAEAIITPTFQALAQECLVAETAVSELVLMAEKEKANETSEVKVEPQTTQSEEAA